VKHLGNPKKGDRQLKTVTCQLPEYLIKALDEEGEKVDVSRQKIMAAILATALKDPKFTINWDLVN
jgi:hypothetical protein